MVHGPPWNTCYISTIQSPTRAITGPSPLNIQHSPLYCRLLINSLILPIQSGLSAWTHRTPNLTQQIGCPRYLSSTNLDDCEKKSCLPPYRKLFKMEKVSFDIESCLKWWYWRIVWQIVEGLDLSIKGLLIDNILSDLQNSDIRNTWNDKG
jgi:hypothetical protein